MDLLETLKNFQNEYQKIIQDFQVIDDNDPISPEHMKQLEDSLNQWYQTLKNNFTIQLGFYERYLDKNQDTYAKYTETVDFLNKKLSQNLKSITDYHIEACKKLKEKIEKSKGSYLFTIEQLELDYECFIRTSEQNKIILDEDFEKAKKRYDYQRDEAKDSYLDVVKKKNEILENAKKTLAQNYDESISQYQIEYQELIEKLNHLIDEKSSELEKLSMALENEKNNMKEKYRQESASLNAAIKKFVDDKNKTIDLARNQYNKSMNDAGIERENKKQVYQVKSQALLREFVTKINEIDEQTSQLKKEYDIKSNQIKRDYYSNLFERTKLFHSQLEKIYASSSGAHLDRYTNHLIQYKNKQYILETNIQKKANELQLLNLTRSHTIALQDNKNNKNFLEIDKNYAIKEITNQEQFDNKYYQEKDNFYESDFNFIVKSANYRFSQKANILRCQSQIRTKLLERNYDSIEANYYKKIEILQNKINSYQLEKKLATELLKLVLEYQKDTYLDHLHLEEVTNLLDIEKNKLLKEFNQAQYEYQIKNIQLERDYGLKKIDLENQKEEKHTQLNKELENELLKKNNVSTSFSIKREELEEKYSKLKAQIKNSNALKTNKEKYLANLRVNDIFYLNQISASFNHFFESFLRVIQDTLHTILNTEIEANLQYLNSFIHAFFEIFNHLFVGTFEYLYQTILKIIDYRLDYIQKFKYQSSIDTLKENHLEYQTKIKDTKNHILDEMDSANKTIENFKQKIFTLINDNEMLKQNPRYHKKRLDSVTLSAIKENELKIRDYKEKIDDFNQMNKMHADDLDDLNQKTLINSSSYNKEIKKINQMLYHDSLTILNFKGTITNYYKSMMRSFGHCQETLLDEIEEGKDFIKKINRIQKNYQVLLLSCKNQLILNLNHYAKASNDETLKNRAIAKQEWKEETRRFSAQYTKANDNFTKEYKLTIATYERQVHEQKTLIENTLAFYDQLLLDAKNTFEKNSSLNQAQINSKINHFLSSYYAMDDNNHHIVSYHRQAIENRDIDFKNNKDQCVNKNNSEKDEINEKLSNFIKTKNEEIEHLPIAFKFNSKMLNKETRKKNNQIHKDLRQAKTDHNLEHKRIDKEINNLKAQLSQEQSSNELTQRQNIAKEKKDHQSSLKQSLKSISIHL